MTLATNTAPAIDPAWLAELTAELATYGYKVTKARGTRASTSTEPTIGPCVHCYARTSRTTRIGSKKARTLRTVHVCDDCRRYGPRGDLSQGLQRLSTEDAERYRRLYGAWRRAHSHYRKGNSYTPASRWAQATIRTHPRIVALERAMHELTARRSAA